MYGRPWMPLARNTSFIAPMAFNVLGKPRKGAPLVDGFADGNRRSATVERGAYVRAQLRQRLVRGEHGRRDELAQGVVQLPDVQHFAEDRAFEDRHELRIRSVERTGLLTKGASSASACLRTAASPTASRTRAATKRIA